MTIERGVAWGTPASTERVTARATDDAALAARAADGYRRGERAVVALERDEQRGRAGDDLIGDVARTVGVGRVRPAADRVAYPFDLGFVAVDHGEPIPFVATMIARRSRWAGEFAVVTNCGWFGDWYVGPKAHPNDGLLDVTVGRLGPRQRLIARRRITAGAHLPHPGLTTLRTDRWVHRFERSVSLVVDGVSRGSGTAIEVELIPDCFVLCV